MKLLSSLRRRRNVSLETAGGDSAAEDVSDAAAARRRRMERPPDDDVCPICFGNFVYPCRGLCGHWYCGSCILMYWNYGSAVQPCKCPMCSQKITRLTLDTSMNGHEDGDIHAKIENYNYLFVGGMHGVLRRVVQLPLLVRRLFLAAMDPDGGVNVYNQMRIIGILVGVIYCSLPWDLLPRGSLTTPRAFELFAMLLFMVLRLVGYIRRWQRRREVREVRPLLV